MERDWGLFGERVAAAEAVIVAHRRSLGAARALQDTHEEQAAMVSRAVAIVTSGAAREVADRVDASRDAVAAVLARELASLEIELSRRPTHDNHGIDAVRVHALVGSQIERVKAAQRALAAAKRAAAAQAPRGGHTFVFLPDDHRSSSTA